MNDPLRHTLKMQARLGDLAEHLRQDVQKVDEPQAKALFETAAEILQGLRKAFADYEKGEEDAWQRRVN